MGVFHWKSDLITNFDAAVDWTDDGSDDTGPSNGPDAVPSNVGVRLQAAAYSTDLAGAKSRTLTTLVSFLGAEGSYPDGVLIADAAGDLFGITSGGGANDRGTVFEIVRTQNGYASAPTTLVSFSGADGAFPYAGLIADAAGNLFGTTLQGGADNDGTVFEIAKTKGGFAGAPITLASFTGTDGWYLQGGLCTDAAGDLFGTTSRGGADNDGTVFEIVKTAHGFAGAPTTLVSFAGADGSTPVGSLIADAAGDLFGTTRYGGADNDGTVFEIAKTKGGYASAPTTLVSFTGADGSQPLASLLADAAGDLFGTTYQGGSDNDGTVFEIAKTSSGYASTPTILASFTGADGADPVCSLIVDAKGDIFGTTEEGGINNEGMVFEIAKTGAGYAAAPTILVKFDGRNGSNPLDGLLANAAGDLFGTTSEILFNGDGTVFELSKAKTGYAVPATPAADGAHSLPGSAAFVQAMASHGPVLSGEATPTFLTWRHEISTRLSRPQVA
jgi:uncharacterized repeat protein (TIGR03803 family)